MFSKKVAGFVRINEKLWPRLPLHVVLWGKRIQNAKNFQYIISCSMSRNFETTVGVLYMYQNNIHLHWIIHSSNMFLKQIYFFFYKHTFLNLALQSLVYLFHDPIQFQRADTSSLPEWSPFPPIAWIFVIMRSFIIKRDIKNKCTN